MDAWLLFVVGGLVVGGLALTGRALARVGALSAMGEGWLRASGARRRGST